MKKILTIVGARPQFIKAAIVSQKFSDFEDFEEVLVHTGQHYDENMSNVFFSELSIPKPGYTLNINNCSHAEMTGKMLIELDKVFDAVEPDALLVYGDTNSTLAASLVAAKKDIPIIHVEAGLRSNNRKMPEEINRVLTDHVSSLLFTPCENASKTLLKEGIEEDKVIFVGDVMFDLFLQIKSKLRPVDSESKKYVVCTIHRQDNTDDSEKLVQIFKKLDELHEDIEVIMPLHPRTKKMIETYDIKTNVTFVKPVSYIDMMELVAGAQFVITDSGGLQKEAFFNEKVCITIREETEWVELIDINWNTLYDLSSGKPLLDVYNEINRKKVIGASPYGTGNASTLILEHIQKNLR